MNLYSNRQTKYADQKTLDATEAKKQSAQFSEKQMELRDKFAIAAMTGDWAVQDLKTGPCFSDSDFIARTALYYRIADAMLISRSQK